MRKLSLVLMLAAACVVAAFVYHLSPFGEAQPASDTASGRLIPPPPQPPAPVETYETFGGLWRVDNGFDSSLRIRNELLVAPLDVIPILYMADGTEYDLPSVHLAKGGVAEVNLNHALSGISATLASHLSQFGSAGLRWRYTSSGHVIASIQMLNIPQSLIFVAPFNGVESAHVHAHAVEGLWWRHDPDVGGFVSVANVTDQVIQVHIQAVSAGGARAPAAFLQLPGHSTKMLDLDELVAGPPEPASQAGGLRVEYNGPMGGIAVTGGLVNASEGYSATMPFWFHDRTKSAPVSINYASAGIMAGAPDPMMGFPRGTQFEPYVVLRNSTERPLQVSPVLNWMAGNSQPVTRSLPSLMLPPYHTRRVNMKAVLAAAGLAGFNGNLNLSLAFTGHAGDLVVATGSVDDTGTYVFEVEPQGVGESNGKLPAYWTVANGFDTMYSLWNPTGQAQDLTVTLYYGDGSGSYVLPVHLAAQGSTMIDMMMLIESQQPDANGHTIPMTVTSGSASIESAAGRKTSITLAVAGGTFNVQTATCGVTCVNCCGDSGFAMVPSNFTCPIGESMQCNVQATDCYGYSHDLSATWSSSNTSIMTVNSSTGVITGIAPGAITLTAQLAPVQTDTGQVCTSSGGQPVCPTGTPTESTTTTATMQAQISSTSVSPTKINRSTSPTTATVTVQVYHQSAGSGSGTVTVEVGTYSSNPAGINVTYNPTSKSVTLLGPAGNVTVTFEVYSPTGTGTIIIQSSLANPSTGVTIAAPAPSSNGQATLNVTQN